MADDVIMVDQAQARTFTGRAAAESLLYTFFTSGFTSTLVSDPLLTVDGVNAVLEFTFQGRQTGPLFGIAPTGRAVVLPMVLACQLCNGAVWRARLYYNAGVLLRQLGLAL